MQKLGLYFWNLLNKFMRFFVFQILHLNISERNWEKLLQFVKFGIVGLSNTVISYGIYVFFLLIFQNWNLLPSIDYLAAQIIAFLLSVLWSFYWNRRYVFKVDNNKGPWLQALLKTYISYAFTGLILNSLLSILWVQLLGFPKIIAPIINLLISVPLNFVLNKFWAFKEK